MDNINRACFVMALLMAGRAGDLSANSIVDPCVNLTAPIQTNGQVSLALSGEPGVSYVVQSSQDLQNWAPAATNGDSAITRVLTFPAPDAAGFYRVSRAPLPRFDCAIAVRGEVLPVRGEMSPQLGRKAICLQELWPFRRALE